MFHTDPDPDIQPLERTPYARARRLAIPIEPATRVSRLREDIARGSVPVVFYRVFVDPLVHKPGYRPHDQTDGRVATRSTAGSDDDDTWRRSWRHGWSQVRQQATRRRGGFL